MRTFVARKRGGDLADQLICDHALFHLGRTCAGLELTAAGWTIWGAGSL